MVIYKLTNQINGKVYIGQTRQSLRKRLNSHRYAASNFKGCPFLGSAIRKYGWTAFTAEILAETNSNAELNLLEIGFIETFRSMDCNFGYNLVCGGYGGPPSKEISDERSRKYTGTGNPRYGKKVSEHTKRLMREGLKEKWNEKGHREKMKQSRDLFCRSPEFLLKLRNSHLGKALKPCPRLIHYDGRIIPEGSNRVEICRSHGLQTANLSKLISGKITQYKGWVLYGSC